jgi:hypothetical protein
MDELFLITEQGKIPIRQDMIKKYSLTKGMRSPFTNNMIADKNGDSTLEQKVEDRPTSEKMNEETPVFTAAEAIDIAQGADSEV